MNNLVFVAACGVSLQQQLQRLHVEVELETEIILNITGNFNLLETIAVCSYYYSEILLYISRHFNLLEPIAVWSHSDCE